ncbi:MAG: ATP-binding protein [Chloroflexia bacterium]|nr:ATP-binding protein [Chloroflexia bacterium]
MTSAPHVDQLARRLAPAPRSRRATLGALVGGLLAASGRGRARPALAAPASQATPASAGPALDPETISNIAQALWLPAATVDQFPAEVQQRIMAPANSNAAFGERMRYYLQNLIDYPDSFTPDYTERYQTLIAHAATLSAHQSYVYNNFLGADKTRDYDPIPPRAELRFPQANGMSLGTQTGWYFAVGSARDRAGIEYGIELMFFRSAILPPPIARHHGLSDTENQVLELQLAISVAGERHYQAAPVIIAGTTGLLSFATGAIGATLGRNAFRQLDPATPFPLQIEARGWDQTGSTPVELGLDLTFTTGRDYLLQGVDGCTPCCAGVGTLYYSIPNLELDPNQSTITLDGAEIALSSGSFWFDHQWGNGLGGGNARSEALRAAAILAPASLGGWDWFMAQFTGNRQLTLAAIHAGDNERFYFQTGPTAPGTMVVPATGKLMDETGAVHELTGTLTVDQWVKSETTPDPALYWPTYAWYPDHWRFDLTAGAPAALASFTMTPIVAGGQAAFFANGAQYSEGAVILHDAAGTEVGRGFAESVNYADTFLNKLALAGLPVTVDMAAALAPVTPSLVLEAESALNAATHRDEIADELGLCVGLFPASS